MSKLIHTGSNQYQSPVEKVMKRRRNAPKASTTKTTGMKRTTNRRTPAKKGKS